MQLALQAQEPCLHLSAQTLHLHTERTRLGLPRLSIGSQRIP
jgi:hypothetical protein